MSTTADDRRFEQIEKDIDDLKKAISDILKRLEAIEKKRYHYQSQDHRKK